MISKGIGLGYLTDEIIKYHRESGDMSIRTFDGQTYFMPRYIREKIWTHLELVNVMHEAIRKLKQKGIINDEFDPYSIVNHINAAYNHLDNVNRKLHHK